MVSTAQAHRLDAASNRDGKHWVAPSPAKHLAHGSIVPKERGPEASRVRACEARARAPRRPGHLRPGPGPRVMPVLRHPPIPLLHHQDASRRRPLFEQDGVEYSPIDRNVNHLRSCPPTGLRKARPDDRLQRAPSLCRITLVPRFPPSRSALRRTAKPPKLAVRAWRVAGTNGETATVLSARKVRNIRPKNSLVWLRPTRKSGRME
jgi:hypothetical protein